MAFFLPRKLNATGTYVQRLSKVNPSRLGLDVKVIEVPGIEGRCQAVPDGSVVVRVLVGGRHTQDVRANVRVLFHVLDVFLEG